MLAFLLHCHKWRPVFSLLQTHALILKSEQKRDLMKGWEKLAQRRTLKLLHLKKLISSIQCRFQLQATKAVLLKQCYFSKRCQAKNSHALSSQYPAANICPTVSSNCSNYITSYPYWPHRSSNFTEVVVFVNITVLLDQQNPFAVPKVAMLPCCCEIQRVKG